MSNELTYKDRTMSRSKALRYPGRMFTFLQAIARRPVIFMRLQEFGYSKAIHNEGQSILNRVTTLQIPEEIPSTNPDYAQSLVFVDNWDEPNFALTHAALAFRFPSQHKYMFGGDLKAARGDDAIKSVSLYVERYKALRDGTDKSRSKTREQDKAAMKLLNERSIITDDILAGLENHLRILKDVPELQNFLPTKQEKDDYIKALFDLELWFEDWSSVAKTVFRDRKDYRISLGLSERKPNKKAEATEEEGFFQS